MSTFGAYRRNSRGAVAACLVTTMTASSASLTPTRASRTWPSACAWKVKVSCDGRSACGRSEEHTSELQSRLHLVCRLLLEKKKKSRNRHQKRYEHCSRICSPVSVLSCL